MERERDTESYFRKRAETLGCLLLKWVSPGNDGVPDRILIIPGGHVWFIEFKTTAGRLSKIQQLWQQRLKERGCKAIVIRGKEEAAELAEAIKAYMTGGG